MSKQRFYVIEHINQNTRVVFEIYERLGRVLILTTRGSGTHDYTNLSLAEARDHWRMHQTEDFIRNEEMEKSLNA